MRPLIPLLGGALWVCVASCAKTGACKVGAADDHAAPGIAVNVLDRGTKPRAPLRYEYTEGGTERSRLELLFETAVESEGGVTAAGLLPPIVVDVEAGPVEVTPSGHFRYPIQVVNTQLAVESGEAGAVEEAEKELAALEGLGGSVEVDTCGALRERSFDIPPDVPRDSAVMLGNVRTALMSVPFPEQPVGVGARWETEGDLRVGGLMARQRVTYTLAAVDEQGGMLEVVVHTSAPPQDIEGGRVHAYETSGIGSVNFLFDRLTPLSEADVTNLTRVTAVIEGEPVTAQKRTRTVMRLYNLEHSEAPPAEAPESEMPQGGDDEDGSASPSRGTEAPAP